MRIYRFCNICPILVVIKSIVPLYCSLYLLLLRYFGISDEFMLFVVLSSQKLEGYDIYSAFALT